MWRLRIRFSPGGMLISLAIPPLLSSVITSQYGAVYALCGLAPSQGLNMRFSFWQVLCLSVGGEIRIVVVSHAEPPLSPTKTTAGVC